MSAPDLRAEKRAAALAAASVVEDGMWVGLGTGSTVAELVPALGERGLAITCVAQRPPADREELLRKLPKFIRSLSPAMRRASSTVFDMKSLRRCCSMKFKSRRLKFVTSRSS